MDKTELVQKVAQLFRVTEHKVDISIKLEHREIDIIATPLQGLVRAPILVECADYSHTVGVEKIQSDIAKLVAARKSIGQSCVFMHVSTNGHSSEALGMAREESISCYTLQALISNLVNFDPYIDKIENEVVRQVIETEYQPTKMFYDDDPKKKNRPFCLQQIGYAQKAVSPVT